MMQQPLHLDRSFHRWLGWLVAPVMALPLTLGAHSLPGERLGFATGFRHPISGLDHVIAMVAVGLWGAQLGAPAIWLLPVAFPLIMAVGGFFGLVGIPLPGVEIGIAASGVVLGTAVLLQWRPPLAAAVSIVGIFGLFHGYAHGAELPAGQNPATYSLGFVMATGLLHMTGIAIGMIRRWAWGGRAIQVLGGGVLAGGLFYFWRAVS